MAADTHSSWGKGSVWGSVSILYNCAIETTGEAAEGYILGVPCSLRDKKHTAKREQNKKTPNRTE